MPNVQGLFANDHKDLMNKVRQFITGYGTFPTPGYVGTGDGTISDVASPPPSLSETWTITCNLGGGVGVGTFTVTGSTSGAQADATVGEFYDGAGGLIEFLINDGAIDFIITDEFTVVITEGAMITSGEEWAQDRWVPDANDRLTGTNFETNPLNAMDGFITTLVKRTGFTTAIYQVEYDDAVEFDSYQIFSSSAGDPSFVEPDDRPTEWTLESSDDGITWTARDFKTGIDLIIGIGETSSLASPGRHKFWRWVFSANDGGANVTIGDITTRVTGDLLYTADNGHLLVTGQGLAAADTIFVGMRIQENITSPYFNWKIQGAVAFDDAATFDNQPSVSLQTFYVLDDGTIEYWIIATGRYFIVVTKLGTVYTSMMMGLFLPYGVPAEYGYPLVICGNIGSTPLHFTNTDSRFRGFWNPGENAMYVRDPSGSWLEFENRTGTSPGSISNLKNAWPYGGASNSKVQNFQPHVTAGIDGSYALTPVILAEYETPAGEVGKNSNAYGELDGVFHISGENNTAENTITIGGDDYICFPDIFRIAFDSFVALRLDI